MQAIETDQTSHGVIVLREIQVCINKTVTEKHKLIVPSRPFIFNHIIAIFRSIDNSARL